MKNEYTISEVAALLGGINPQRIRHAHKVGGVPIRRKRPYQRHWYNGQEILALCDYLDRPVPAQFKGMAEE